MCPASTLARVTIALPWIASRAGVVHAVFRFRNPTGAVRRVATREMLSVRFDSPHYEGTVPSRAAVETPGRHGHVSGSGDCSRDRLTCHAGLHQSVRRPFAGHAPRVLSVTRRSATRSFYGQRGLAERVRRIAPRLRLIRRRSGFAAPFAVLCHSPGGIRVSARLTRVPFDPPVRSPDRFHRAIAPPARFCHGEVDGCRSRMWWISASGLCSR